MLTITYFDCRGRVEPIRLLLSELAIPFEEHHIEAADWPDIKPTTPFGSLPSYEDGDLTIWQTHAVVRHLARTHDLYGASEAERVECDVLEEAFAQLNDLVGRQPWRPDAEPGRSDFLGLELGPVLARLERHLARPHDSPSFCVGASLTFVDLLAFGVLDHTRSLFPEIGGKHPLLEAFCEKIAARPRIATYLESDQRLAAIQFGPNGQMFERGPGR